MSLAALPSPQRETVAQRVRRLQREATEGARDHSRELLTALAAVETLAKEIAVQGAPYHPGVVEEARQLAEEAEARVMRMDRLLARAPR